MRSPIPHRGGTLSQRRSAADVNDPRHDDAVCVEPPRAPPERQVDLFALDGCSVDGGGADDRRPPRSSDGTRRAARMRDPDSPDPLTRLSGRDRAALRGVGPLVPGRRGALRIWLGLPDWVAVALLCYLAAAVVNAVAWLITDVPDDGPPDPTRREGGRGRMSFGVWGSRRSSSTSRRWSWSPRSRDARANDLAPRITSWRAAILGVFVLFLTLYATAYSGNSLLGYPGRGLSRAASPSSWRRAS